MEGTTVLSAAARAGDEAIRDADLAGLGRLADAVDHAAVLAIAFTVRRHGLFTDPETRHDLAEICTATRTAPRHHRIIRRWLRVLVGEGMLTPDGDGRYRGLVPVSASEVERARRQVDDLGSMLAHGQGLTRFFGAAVAYLPELLRDEISLQALLFADGDLDVAEDVYRRNAASRYTNQVCASVVESLATAHVPLRVVEVGAGIGGTTADVVSAIADHQVDYHFTDVSRFFLSSARDRFRAHPWVRYGLLDINRDLSAQGFAPGCADVVLAANVLHNARHAGTVLAGLRELIEPGGHLVFIDTSREHYQLMTSMQFLMSPAATDPDADFTDFRAGTDRIFPTRDEWLRELASAGFEPLLCLPDEGHPLARLGQYAFVGRRGR